MRAPQRACRLNYEKTGNYAAQADRHSDRFKRSLDSGVWIFSFFINNLEPLIAAF